MARFLLTSLIILYLSCHSCSINVGDVDETKTLLWGPGLHPMDVTLRARYFFVQLVDAKGIKYVLLQLFAFRMILKLLIYFFLQHHRIPKRISSFR